MADGTHQIRLIVGLGNPDSKYEGTRHNAGFMFAERLLTKLPRSFQRIHGFQSYYWKGTYAGAPLIVQTPLTYMNLSGEAVAPLMRSEGIAPDEVLVVNQQPYGVDRGDSRIIRLENNRSSSYHLHR